MPPVTIPAICRHAYAYGLLAEQVRWYLKDIISEQTLREVLLKTDAIAAGRGDLVIEEGE